MRKYLFWILCNISMGALAQAPDERKAILEPVTRLFTGMNLGDSAMVHSAFTTQVSMATISKDKSGNPLIRYESSLDGFLKAVGTPHDKAWSEPIWEVKVEQDGNMAQVWAKYAFYLGNTFSHFSLADTRQKEGCEIPASVSSGFK